MRSGPTGHIPNMGVRLTKRRKLIFEACAVSHFHEDEHRRYVIAYVLETRKPLPLAIPSSANRNDL